MASGKPPKLVDRGRGFDADNKPGPLGSKVGNYGKAAVAPPKPKAKPKAKGK